MSVRQPIRSDLASRSETRGLSYLVVEGPAGSGKTALASQLARNLGGRLVLDRAEANPFLKDFFSDPKRFAFKTQLFFTLSRYMQQEVIAQQDLFHTLLVSDYLFVRDRIYASLILDDRELALYQKLVGLMEEDIPRPDLVIYLHCDADTLLDNLMERGGKLSVPINREYMISVVEAYNYYFLHFEEAPLLIINAKTIDPTGSPEAMADLISELEKPHSGINYYSPAL